MIKIAIVEDEEDVAKNTSEFIRRYMSENNIEYKAKWFPSGESFLFSDVNEFDIILLDIQLQKMDGMTVAKKVREGNQEVAIVFVTSLAQYAINGYEVGALDFIIKPLNYYNFALKFRRAVNCALRNVDDNIVVRNRLQTNVIRIQDILYVETVGHAVTYHTKNGTFQTTGTMKKIKNELSNYPFSLCNQSFLVNLRYVTQADSSFVVVKDEKLAMSRTRRKEFMGDLNKYLADNACKGGGNHV